jgi:hypothetical protein
MQVENKGEHNKMDEKYAIYSLFPEDARFSKRYVSTKICVSPKASYQIYNYDKTILSSLDTIHDKYRSVVFSYPENQLLCFSPPKSMEYYDFAKKYFNTKGEHGSIIATEKIEGISIQLFYDPRIQSWEISTKTNIGGNYWYFLKSDFDSKKSPTFYDMFLDALMQPRDTPLNNNPWISELPKSYSYSFVLQHSENQILIPIKSPKLCLVAIYEIRDNCAIHIPSAEYKSWPILMNMVGVIDFPKSIDIGGFANNSGSEAEGVRENSVEHTSKEFGELQKYVSKYINHPFRLSKGIVLWNEKTGERTLLNNPNYTDLVKLRGIPPGVQYEYFCMKRIGQVSQYMEHLPHYKKMVMTMEHIYAEFVKTLHRCYMDVYVFKRECLNNVSHQYKPYLENLHKNIYLPSLRTRRPVKITKQVVQSYIDKMEPREQLFLFSYLRRERDNV